MKYFALSLIALAIAGGVYLVGTKDALAFQGNGAGAGQNPERVQLRQDYFDGNISWEKMHQRMLEFAEQRWDEVGLSEEEKAQRRERWENRTEGDCQGGMFRGRNQKNSN